MNDAYNNIELLKQKLDIVEGIGKNTAAQATALAEKSFSYLKSLLDERQRYVDKFAALERLCPQKSTVEHQNEQASHLERILKTKIKEVLKQNSINVSDADKWLGDLSQSIKHVKTGEMALKKGYYREIPQQYGYFFDKKIGK